MLVRVSARQPAAETPRRAVAAVGAVLASISVAACGGGADPGTGANQLGSGPEPEPPPQAGLAEAADGLCLAAQAREEEIRRELGGDQLTLGDRARLLVDLAPVRVRLAEQLEELDAPSGADDAAELVRVAGSRGAASTRAGSLWERGASEERIAAAAAREHEDRLAFVELARRLGLGACAERLSDGEREEIAATLSRALTAARARRRCAAYGERYLEQEFEGGVEECATSARPPRRADRVEIRELQGMDEVFAVAQIELAGGDAPGRYRARITYEDGSYRIDKLD